MAKQPFGRLHVMHEPLHPLARKILAAAKINGLELELPPFQYPATTRAPEFQAKFPRGKAPAFESTSGDFRIAESGAIAYYVSASGPKAAQLLGGSPEERARVQEWIFWHELELGPPLRDLIWWRLGTTAYEPRKEDEAAKILDEHLEYLEKTLEGRTWLVNNSHGGPSLADLTVGASLLFACRFYIDRSMRERLPNIIAHLDRLKAVEGLGELFTIHFIEERQQAPAVMP